MSDHRAEFEEWATERADKQEGMSLYATSAEYYAMFAWDAWNARSATIDALREALREFHEAWPGGLDEVEASVSGWRARAICHERRLTAAGIPIEDPIHPQLLADCDADGYLIDAALETTK